MTELGILGVRKGWLGAEYKTAQRPWVSMMRGTKSLEKGAERKVGDSKGKLHLRKNCVWPALHHEN